MSKYINSEKLLTEIERRIEEYNIQSLRGAELADVRSFITSLQQEQEQHVIGGQVFGATDIEQLYKGKVYIVSNLVQDTEFGIEPRDEVKMLLIKD